MGTQTSHPGPMDRQPLLPDWALEPPPPPPGVEPPQVVVEPTIPQPIDVPTSTPTPDSPPLPPPAPVKVPQRWTAARKRIGKVVSGGGRDALRKAGRAYVRALGGSRAAAGKARAGRKSTVALGSFLAAVVRDGLTLALEGLRLGSVIGKDPATVFAAICNAIAPSGAARDQAAARNAINEALWFLYERTVPETATTTDLSGLSAEMVKEAVTEATAAFIYELWLSELGLQIEKEAISAEQAVKLEREMRIYVHDAAKIEFGQVDVLTLNWTKGEGEALVKKLFEDAFGFIGGTS